MNRDEVRKHLSGPITSIRTPFKANGEVDFDGLRRFLDFCIEAGSKTMLLTAGDSHYACLSDEEIAEITRTTVEQTRRRAMVVAADRYHGTDRAVAFAEFAREAGADVVMCLPPDWGKSCTPKTLAEHYAEVARAMPVMIVTNIFRPRGDTFGLETIEHALDRLDKAVRAHEPDIVIIQFGINDSYVDSTDPKGQSRIPLQKYIDNLTHIVQTLRSDGSRIIMMTPNCLGKEKEPWRRERLSRYAQAFREVAVSQKAPLVDIWRAFMDHGAIEGRDIDDLLLDGMHPNDKGHAIIADLLAKQIAALNDSKVAAEARQVPPRGYSIPTIDLSGDKHLQVVVSRIKGQYLGQTDTLLMGDNKTMFVGYPEGYILQMKGNFMIAYITLPIFVFWVLLFMFLLAQQRHIDSFRGAGAICIFPDILLIFFSVFCFLVASSRNFSKYRSSLSWEPMESRPRQPRPFCSRNAAFNSRSAIIRAFSSVLSRNRTDFFSGFEPHYPCRSVTGWKYSDQILQRPTKFSPSSFSTHR